jgi:phosphoribosyl 1,2-cyclic phosphodiesterase
MARVDAVFLTHEHSDHCSGVESLKKFPHLKFFANSGTARAVQKMLTWAPTWQIFTTGSSFRYRDLDVESFAIPHDAQEPVGFRFTSGRDDLFSPRRSLAWVTDLGHAPPVVRERIRECDVVVVEANHCPRMLEADPKRSWTLKRRISGRHGHLSNERMRELLGSVASPRWKKVYLAHLSRDCNTHDAVDLALDPLRTVLHCEFAIVGHGQGTPFYELT